MNKLVIVLVLLISNISFAEIKIECASHKNNIPFNKLDIFDGNPIEKAQLKPDNGDDPLPHKWTLTNTKPWVVCKYGSEATVRTTKRIKSKVKKCEMTPTNSGIFNVLLCE